MNTAYAQHASSLCHRNDSRQDVTFRSSAAASYPSSNSMPLQPQSHVSASFAGSYLPLTSSRAPIQDSIHSSGDVLAPLPSVGQPPTSEPMPTSCHHNGKKYQYVICALAKKKRKKNYQVVKKNLD